MHVRLRYSGEDLLKTMLVIGGLVYLLLIVASSCLSASEQIGEDKRPHIRIPDRVSQVYNTIKKLEEAKQAHDTSNKEETVKGQSEIPQAFENGQKSEIVISYPKIKLDEEIGHTEDTTDIHNEGFEEKFKGHGESSTVAGIPFRSFYIPVLSGIGEGYPFLKSLPYIGTIPYIIASPASNWYEDPLSTPGSFESESKVKNRVIPTDRVYRGAEKDDLQAQSGVYGDSDEMLLSDQLLNDINRVTKETDTGEGSFTNSAYGSSTPVQTTGQTAPYDYRRGTFLLGGNRFTGGIGASGAIQGEGSISFGLLGGGNIVGNYPGAQGPNGVYYGSGQGNGQFISQTGSSGGGYVTGVVLPQGNGVAQGSLINSGSGSISGGTGQFSGVNQATGGGALGNGNLNTGGASTAGGNTGVSGASTSGGNFASAGGLDNGAFVGSLAQGGVTSSQTSGVTQGFITTGSNGLQGPGGVINLPQGSVAGTNLIQGGGGSGNIIQGVEAGANGLQGSGSGLAQVVGSGTTSQIGSVQGVQYGQVTQQAQSGNYQSLQGSPLYQGGYYVQIPQGAYTQGGQVFVAQQGSSSTGGSQIVSQQAPGPIFIPQGSQLPPGVIFIPQGIQAPTNLAQQGNYGSQWGSANTGGYYVNSQSSGANFGGLSGVQGQNQVVQGQNQVVQGQNQVVQGQLGAANNINQQGIAASQGGFVQQQQQQQQQGIAQGGFTSQAPNQGGYYSGVTHQHGWSSGVTGLLGGGIETSHQHSHQIGAGPVPGQQNTISGGISHSSSHGFTIKKPRPIFQNRPLFGPIQGSISAFLRRQCEYLNKQDKTTPSL